MLALTLDRMLEQRDAEAALYLLERMLGVGDEVLQQSRREELAHLREKVKKSQRISANDKVSLIAAYREVIG